MAYNITRTKDLKLYLGTVCNGSIAVGTTALTAAGSLTQADVGNPVWVLGAGADTSPSTGDNAILYSTIASVEDADSCTIADAAITGIETGFNIVIVWRPVSALVDSIKLTRSLTVRDALDFNIQQLVTEGTPVLLADQSEVLFGGVVQKSRANNIPGTDDVDTLCTCVGWDYLFSKRQSGLFTYENMSAGDVFAQLIVNSLGADYVGVQIDDAGPVIDSITFDYEPCSSAADRIVSLCNTELDTYYWYVDPLRVAHLAKQSTTAAPWGVDDADGSDENIRIEVSVEKSNEKRYNRVYIKATQLLGLSVTEGIDGDGSAKQFSVTSPIGQEPTIELNGSAQTVGIQGVDTGMQWYWNKGSNVIYQDDAGTTLTSGDHLSVVYKPFTQGLALYNYGTDVDAVSAVEGGTGYYEKVVTVTAPTTEPAINALAEALAKKFGTKITAISATTNRSGLKPGMLWPVALSELNIDGSYLIDQVSLTSTSSVCYWQIHAVGSPLIGDWRKAFIDLAKEDTDTRGAGAGNGGGGTIPPSRINWDWVQEPLTGTVDGVNREFTTTWVPLRSIKTGNQIIHVLRNQADLDMFVDPSTISPERQITYADLNGQFAIDSNRVTFEVAPKIGDRVRAYYPPTDETPTSVDRTGVWLARPTRFLEAYEPEAGEDLTGALYWAGGTPSPMMPYNGYAVGGNIIKRNSSVRTYPESAWTDFEMPPGHEYPNFDSTAFEKATINCRFSLLSDAVIDGAVDLKWLHSWLDHTQQLFPPPLTQYYGTSDLLRDNYLHSYTFAERDDNDNTIPSDLHTPGAWSHHAVLWSSLNIDGVSGHSKVLSIHDQYLELYANAIRINCGGNSIAVAESGKTYTWGADRAYSGGESFTGDGAGRLANGRKGAFRYTFGRSLYADYFPTSRYKVTLGFHEHQYSSAGQRVFSVTASGYEKVTNLDIYSEVADGEHTEQFEVEIDNFPGVPYLDFAASVGEPLCNWITVEPMLPTGVVG